MGLTKNMSPMFILLLTCVDVIKCPKIIISCNPDMKEVLDKSTNKTICVCRRSGSFVFRRNIDDHTVSHCRPCRKCDLLNPHEIIPCGYFSDTVCCPHVNLWTCMKQFGLSTPEAKTKDPISITKAECQDPTRMIQTNPDGSIECPCREGFKPQRRNAVDATLYSCVPFIEIISTTKATPSSSTTITPSSSTTITPSSSTTTTPSLSTTTPTTISMTTTEPTTTNPREETQREEMGDDGNVLATKIFIFFFAVIFVVLCCCPKAQRSNRSVSQV